MSVKNCRECRGLVSTEAVACPHCGAPVSTRAVGTAIQPIERTAKSLKSRVVISLLCFLVGVIWAITATNTGANRTWPLLLCLFGLLWFLETKARIWWHHG